MENKNAKKQQYYDTIIIGAGMSGIGAAKYLENKNQHYLILQAQDQIGGRVRSINFDGLDIDLGAYQIPNFKQGNPIRDQMKKLKWAIQTLNGKTKIYYYDEIEGQIPKKNINSVKIKLRQFIEEVEQTYYDCEKIISYTLAQLIKPFLEKMQKILTQPQFRFLQLSIHMIEQQQGASLENMSPQILISFDQEEDQAMDAYPLPSGTYFKLLKKLSQNLNIRFNQKVHSINYETDKISIKSLSAQYICKNVICCIPLPCLRNKKIVFYPQLDEQRQYFINNMGVGLLNKVILSFNQPFWNEDTRRIKITSKQTGKYPHFINLSKDNKYVLCCFVSESFCKKLNLMTDQEIFFDVITFLKKIFGEKIKFKQGYYTRWENNEYALGSYGYLAKNTTVKNVKDMRKSIDNKIWFAGQYLYYQNMGCAHGAYQTGILAAKQIYDNMRKQKIFFEEF